MCEIIFEEGLFSAFVTFCDMELLETLYCTTKLIKSLLKKPHVLNCLCKVHSIQKVVPSFYHFLKEYNHRYMREKSFNTDVDYHLLWAIKDNDVVTVKSILETYTATLERNGDENIYEMYFTLGVNGNTEILTLLSNKGLSCEVSGIVMYCAGVAFSGATEFPVDLRSFDNKELSLILFEAVRGNNKELQNTLSKNIPTPYLNRALIFGSVAAGNVRLLTVTLKNLVGNNNF